MCELYYVPHPLQRADLFPDQSLLTFWKLLQPENTLTKVTLLSFQCREDSDSPTPLTTYQKYLP